MKDLFRSQTHENKETTRFNRQMNIYTLQFNIYMSIIEVHDRLRCPTSVQGIHMIYKYKVNITTNVGKYMAYKHWGTTKGVWKKEQLGWNKCVGSISYWHDYSHK